MLANKSLRSNVSATRAAPAPRALSVKVNALFSQNKIDKEATLAEVSRHNARHALLRSVFRSNTVCL